MHDHPPAGRRAQEDVGGRSPRRAACRRAERRLLDRALHREADRLDHHDLLEPERRAACRRRRAAPSRRAPRRSRRAACRRVDADDLLVLGPGRHHRVDVLAPRTPGRTPAPRPAATCRSAACGPWPWSVAVSGGGRAGCRRQGCARQIVHRVGGELAHALEVAERAFALEARAAGDVDLRDLRERRQRRRVGRRRRAEQRDQRHADRGGRVHQPRIVADDERRRATAGRSRCRDRCVPVRSRTCARCIAQRLRAPRRRRACRSASRRARPASRRARKRRASSAKCSAASAWPGRTRRRGTGSRPGGRVFRRSARIAAARLATIGHEHRRGRHRHQRAGAAPRARRSGRRAAAAPCGRAGARRSADPQRASPT